MFKTAAYFDEAGVDFKSACESLDHLNIHYVGLRYDFSGRSIFKINDVASSIIKKTLEQNNLSVVFTVADSAKEHEIDHIFNINHYFNSQAIIFNHNGVEDIPKWMNKIGSHAITNNVVPVLEVDDNYIELLELLNKHNKWKFSFDPAKLIIKKNQDPFVKYWPLIRHKVFVIDVRDYKIGRGYKPPGFGDTNITKIIKDANQFKYKGWMALKPSLGRRYGGALTKSDTFKLAADAFESIVESQSNTRVE